MRPVSLLAISVLVLASACSPQTDRSSPPSSTIEPALTANEIDSQIALDPERAVESSALPPRHLDTSAFPESLVDRTLIVSGGPPPDGIPSIDAPTFAPVGSIDWLDDDEAVLVLDVEGDVHIYPTQIMVWHEIVNDEIAGRPVAVTFCPLCNSGLAFERSVPHPNGTHMVLDFGTSGSLYQSAMVMYDRQTESLWTHFDGRAVIGDLVGVELDRLPLGITSWHDARAAHPSGEVLQRPATDRDYGRNPYEGYDQLDGPIGGFFDGDIDSRLPAMTRVVGLDIGGETLAITLDHLAAERLVAFEIGGQRVVLWHQPGLTSSLEADTVAGGRDIGAVAAFVTDDVFLLGPDGLSDEATNSTWNLFGRAIAGSRSGEQLTVAEKIDTFWFAWSTYHPATAVVDREGPP
ncbi:MAG: DUF3179 domain-containing protein [Acidimicrobiales bacterium]